MRSRVRLMGAGLTCLLLAACDGGPGAPPGGGGCGAGSDNSACGNVGDPYEGNGPAANKQPVSACGTLSSSSTNYKVTQNIGSDPTATCILMDYGTHHVNLDLGGYNVTGAIYDVGEGNGNTVYHGTVTCNRAVAMGDPWSCVQVYPQAGITTAQWRAHHLTVNNQNEGGMGIVFEQDAYHAYTGGGSGLGQPYRFDHISIASPAGTGAGNRFVSMASYGSYGSFEADSNFIHCTGGQLNGCQGMGGGIASPDNTHIHNNQIVMDASSDGFQYGRAVIFEPSPGYQSGGIYVYSNDITATNNMGIRVWGDHAGLLQTGKIYSNIVRDIRLGGIYGGIYLPAQDSVEAEENMEIYGNTLEISTGNAIATDSGYGINVHDNTITCYKNDCSSAAWILRTNEMSYGNNLTAVTIKKTTLPANWGSKNAVLACGPGEPGGYNCMAPAHTTSVTYCNTGTVVGNGTKTESCP
jgi:hypothetical protein